MVKLGGFFYKVYLKMEKKFIYLGNLPSQCTENEIYELFSKFGRIKRIKLFCETFQEVSYPVGYAMVEFHDKSSYNDCINLKNQIQFKESLIHVHENIPDTRFGLSIFVFFTDDNISREKLLENFENIRPSDVRVKNRLCHDRLGFAIIEFPTSEAREMALKFDCEEFPFSIVAPSQNLLDLTFAGSSNQSLSYTPDRLFVQTNELSDRFLDLEVVHRSTPYRVNQFLAAAHSIRIRYLLYSNSSLSRIETRIKIEGDFSPISYFLLGQEIEITRENSKFLFLMAADLQIPKLIEDTSGFVYIQLTPEGALEIVHLLGTVEIAEGPHLNYMAANIDKLRTFKEFQELPVQILATVFKSKYLSPLDPHVFNEWLLSFVRQKPDERVKLIQFINFSSLSRQLSVELITDQTINVNFLRLPLLELLRKGLVSKSSEEKERIDCRQKPDKPEFGVFAMLCERCSGNPHDYGQVRVSSNTTLPKIIEPGWTDWWSTPNDPLSWVLFDFKKHKVVPSGYTLKTMFADVKLPYLRSWCVEGSNDEIHWDLLSEQRNSNTTLDTHKSRTWPIDTQNEYRLIRLKQIDKNGSNNFCMFLHGIELFGKIDDVDLRYESDKEWYGIFDHLTKKSRMNPAEKGEIEIRSSCDPKFLIEQNWSGCWRSPKVANSFVIIEFLTMEINLISYSLRTHYGPAHIRSWDVDVSKDGETWYTVDSRSERNEYKEPYESHHWTCMTPQPDPMKFVRFTMTGPSTRNEHIFWLSHIELFGDIFRRA